MKIGLTEARIQVRFRLISYNLISLNERSAQILADTWILRLEISLYLPLIKPNFFNIVNFFMNRFHSLESLGASWVLPGCFIGASSRLPGGFLGVP